MWKSAESTSIGSRFASVMEVSTQVSTERKEVWTERREVSTEKREVSTESREKGGFNREKGGFNREREVLQRERRFQQIKGGFQHSPGEGFCKTGKIAWLSTDVIVQQLQWSRRNWLSSKLKSSVPRPTHYLFNSNKCIQYEGFFAKALIPAFRRQLLLGYF